MYIKYLSIYLDLYSFLSAEFYCFPYVYLIHSSFPLSTSLFSHTNINVLCFYLQIPNVHCWYIGKQLIFLYSNILLSCCICVIVPGDFLFPFSGIFCIDNYITYEQRQFYSFLLNLYTFLFPFLVSLLYPGLPIL